MSKACFITGTDTGIGKTLVTAGLIQLMSDSGIKVAGMKPIASGCKSTEQGLRNEDAILLMQHSNVDLEYELINPYAFEAPISPHFAARESSQLIDINDIVNKFTTISDSSDFVLVEGIGGWQVPINDELKLSDLAVALNLPVILVVGLKLGCINHALLTADAIREKGLFLTACVASQIEPDYLRREETLCMLEEQLGIPVQLIPWLNDVQPVQITQYLKETKNQIDEKI